MGREGIEPLVGHPAYLMTAALQAAASNTTQSFFSSTRGIRTPIHLVLNQVALPYWRTVPKWPDAESHSLRLADNVKSDHPRLGRASPVAFL